MKMTVSIVVGLIVFPVMTSLYKILIYPLSFGLALHFVLTILGAGYVLDTSLRLVRRRK